MFTDIIAEYFERRRIKKAARNEIHIEATEHSKKKLNNLDAALNEPFDVSVFDDSTSNNNDKRT